MFPISSQNSFIHNSASIHFSKRVDKKLGTSRFLTFVYFSWMTMKTMKRNEMEITKERKN